MRMLPRLRGSWGMLDLLLCGVNKDCSNLNAS
jgi:hypothetical protein